MANEELKDQKPKNNNEDASVKPDKETLNTTDPQEHMEGPLSSLMHKTGESFETDKPEKTAVGKSEE